MKYISISVLLCVATIHAIAQHHPHYNRKYNFSNVDPATLDKEELKKKLEDVRTNSGYDSLQALVHYAYTTDEDQFATLALGYQHAFASFTQLRRELEPFGFGDISENMSNFILSLDVYKNRFMMSYVFTPGFRNLTSNEDYELRIRRRAFEAAIGYDVIKDKRFDLFPQVSIGFQDLNLNVDQKTIDVTTLPDLLDEMVNTSMRKRSFIFTYGGEFDYKIYTPSRARIILGVRYGQVVEPGDGRVRVNGKKSDLHVDDKIATAALSFVIKMVPGAR